MRYFQGICGERGTAYRDLAFSLTLGTSEGLVIREVSLIGIIVVIDSKLEHLTFFKEEVDGDFGLEDGIQVVFHRFRPELSG